MSRDKAAARARAQEMHEQQARQERRREQLLRFGVAAAVLAIVVAVGVAIQAGRSGEGGGDIAVVESTAEVPASLDESGTGITLGDVSAPVTVDIWIDFSCPHCRDFEEENGETIDEIAASGDAEIVYHPASFLTDESATAANAFACSVDSGRALSFLRTAFASQGNFSADDLVAMGEDIGITDAAFASCVRDDTHGDWVAGVQDGMADAGVEGTPTIFVNDELREDLTSATPDDLRAAVEEAVPAG